MLPLEGSGPLGPLLPEHLSEFVVGLVLLVVIFAVVKAKVVPMFEATYAERADAIRGGIERAERAQAEADLAKAEYEAQLTNARDEAARIREEAKNTGAQVIAQMREQANAEAARIVANAQAQIEAERAQARQELRSEIGGLATTLASKIVGEALDDDQRAQRTVDRFIADLEAQQAETNA